jgi:hypothetical protein
MVYYSLISELSFIKVYMAKPITPLLEWLCDEQGDISGKDLAEVSGIAPQTWSKVRQGKQDLSSDLVWRVMCAIALLRPNSEAARVVSIVEGKPSQAHQSISASLSEMIRVADEEELEAAMLQIVRRMFRRQTVHTR